MNPAINITFLQLYQKITAVKTLRLSGAILLANITFLLAVKNAKNANVIFCSKILICCSEITRLSNLNRLSTFLPTCRSVCLSVCVHLSVCLSAYTSICFSACLSVRLSVCPSIH
jgi:hypothetical protein